MILVIMSGLPGSDREVQARQWVNVDPDSRVRTSRDEMRRLITGRARGLSSTEERRVTAAQRGLVKGLLEGGTSVVVDDVNAKLGHRVEWAKLADSVGVPSVHVHVEGDVDDCVAADRDSQFPYGEKAIRDIARRGFGDDEKAGITSAWPARVPDTSEQSNLPTAWIVDIDGTIAINDGHRGWYGAEELKVGDDKAREEIITLLRALLLVPFDERDELIFMTGRTERCRDQTVEWLTRELGLPDSSEVSASLLMREIGDRRKDTVVKDDLFEKHVAGKYRVLGAFEDKPSVSMHWHRKGLSVLHVGSPW